MSASEGGGFKLPKEIKAALFILFVIFLAWYSLGGKDRAKNVNQPFLYPDSPVNSGTEYGPTGVGDSTATVHSW